MIMNIRRFLKNRKGATAIEYGLIAAGMAVVVIVAINVLGDSLNTTFTSIGAGLEKSSAAFEAAAPDGAAE